MERNPSELNRGQQEKLSVDFELAKPEDWASLASIRIEGLKQNPDAFIGVNSPSVPESSDERKWKEYIDDPNRFYLFAKKDSGVIGFAGAYIDYDEKETPEGVWCVQWAYIKPEFRGKGVGERMYAKRLNEIINRGSKSAIGFVLRANQNFDNVMHLNKKLGFEEVVLTPPKHYVKLRIDLTNPEVIKKISEALDEG